MTRKIFSDPKGSHHQRQRRRGAVLVLAAVVMIVLLGFVAFTLDVGFIDLTKTQLQAATDASALSAAQDLGFGFGTHPQSAHDVSTAARATSVDIAGRHFAGARAGVYLDPSRDIRFGQLRWDEATGKWKQYWGTFPYNLIEVTAHRDQEGSAADGSLNLFFAPAIGHRTANVKAISTAAIRPGSGLRRVPGAQVGALPIALDELTWNGVIDGVGFDKWSYNASRQSVSPGSDGSVEVNLYPHGGNNLPSGNRGTVDIGSPNNSTADLKRQILYGLNEFDFSFFPNGEIRFDDGPVHLQGDPGLSAGIESALCQIIGEVRAIPIYRSVQNPGNNARYEIIKFVGVRVLDVKLTGKPQEKRVIVQPAFFMSQAVIPGAVLAPDSIFSPPTLTSNEGDSL